MPKARTRGSAARLRALRTARAYRIGQTVELLRGHLVEIEVTARNFALSGEASNEDLGAELIRAAGQLVHGVLALDRACQRAADLARRSPA